MNDISRKELAKAAQAKTAQKMELIKKPYYVKVLGKRIIIMPHVFAPQPDTILLIRSVKIKKTDRILEPFAGSGTISIFLAQRASNVVATDINPNAIKNIRKNIQLYKLKNKMKAVRANIFPKKESSFNVIVANPPYTDNKAHNMSQRAFWDDQHKTVKSFFNAARKHLEPNGRIYCSWSNFADFGFFEEMVRSSNYKIRPISNISEKWQVYRVYEITPIKKVK